MSIVQGEKVKAAKEGRIVKNGEYLSKLTKKYENNDHSVICFLSLKKPIVKCVCVK